MALHLPRLPLFPQRSPHRTLQRPAANPNPPRPSHPALLNTMGRIPRLGHHPFTTAKPRHEIVERIQTRGRRMRRPETIVFRKGVQDRRRDL